MEVLKWVKDMHTKVAAAAFNIPLSSVFVSETSTYKVPLTRLHVLCGLWPRQNCYCSLLSFLSSLNRFQMPHKLLLLSCRFDCLLIGS